MPNAHHKAVVNASPIIVLAKIRRVGLLRLLYQDIVIPTGAANEIRATKADDPARVWIE